MRISDWSSDVCSADLPRCRRRPYGGRTVRQAGFKVVGQNRPGHHIEHRMMDRHDDMRSSFARMTNGADGKHVPRLQVKRVHQSISQAILGVAHGLIRPRIALDRSEEHTSELQSLMRISYAVFCLNNKTYR